MFTGIIEGVGEVITVEDDADGRRLRVQADLDDLHHGQSIAINGVCLTVEEYGTESELTDSPSQQAQPGTWFELFLSQETVERTYLGDLVVGDVVNVERALPADGRFDGHFVQGHVDVTAEVTHIESVGEDWEFRFSLPADIAHYVVEKGSVAVDGISLTVTDIERRKSDSQTDTDQDQDQDQNFGVAIIPATYECTTLSEKSVGDPVHLEVDVVAKYVESMVSSQQVDTPYR